MKDNLYTHSIDKIKAPSNLLDKTVSRMRSADSESEIFIMKKPKRKIIKLTSAIAAVLAVTIAIGALYFTGGNKTEHSFMLTVDAAEITPETYIEIGELTSITGGGHYKPNAYVDENGNIVFKDNKTEILRLNKEFNVDMVCSGEDIESITYTANNGYLTYDESYEGLIDCVTLTEEEKEKYDAYGSTDNYLWASSCTYDYNKQPQSRLDFELPEDGVDGSFPLRMAFTLFFEEGECVVTPNNEDGDIDDDPIFAEKFNKQADEFSIDITANFTDGTTSTKTLQFKCEDTEGKLLLYAKEVITES